MSAAAPTPWVSGIGLQSEDYFQTVLSPVAPTNVPVVLPTIWTVPKDYMGRIRVLEFRALKANLPTWAVIPIVFLIVVDSTGNAFMRHFLGQINPGVFTWNETQVDWNCSIDYGAEVFPQKPTNALEPLLMSPLPDVWWPPGFSFLLAVDTDDNGDGIGFCNLVVEGQRPDQGEALPNTLPLLVPEGFDTVAA